MFGIPCIVADNLLKLATGEQLKVLLFILRHSGRTLSDEEISANTGVPVMQVQDCILFWQQVNVIIPESTVFSSPVMQMTAPPVPAPAVQNTAPEISAAPKFKEPPKNTQRKKEYLSNSEISELMNSSPDVDELIKISLSILVNMNNTMMNTIIWIYNYLGLKKEVILTLITYCASIGRKEPRYIEKIAADWAEKEIDTLEAANEEVQRLKEYYEFLYVIKRKFEMKHTPTTKQQAFVRKWQEMNLNVEIIHHAYEICRENIEKLSFEYIDKILVSWHENHLISLEEVIEYEKNYRNKKKNIYHSSTDEDFDVEEYAIFINDI